MSRFKTWFKAKEDFSDVFDCIRGGNDSLIVHFKDGSELYFGPYENPFRLMKDGNKVIDKLNEIESV